MGVKERLNPVLSFGFGGAGCARRGRWEQPGSQPQRHVDEGDQRRNLDQRAHDSGQGIESVRPIRDEIKARIQSLLAEILPAQA